MKKFLIGIATAISLSIGCLCITGMKMDGVAVSNYYLVENSTGTVLAARGENERKEIASMVKIMTLLLSFEAVDAGEASLDDMLTISHNAAKQTGSELFVDEGEQYSLSDLIKGTVVVSANDASVAIAEHISGSEQAFVDRMNARASALGMNNTHFVNPTGLPSEEEQYSTAKDVNIMTRELLKHPGYYEYSKIWVEDYKHPSGRVTGLANTNKLIRFYKGCDSGKTGYTDAAKYCLSASASRNGMRVVGTLLGADSSQTRFDAMKTLFNGAFANYKVEKLGSKGECVADVTVSGGKENTVKGVLAEDLCALTGRADQGYTVEYSVNEKIVAPIERGEIIGKAVIVKDGKQTGSVNILAETSVAKADYYDYLKKILDNIWFN